MTTTPPPKRRTRRFLQFSLRSLLVFVLLVSIGMSWLGVKLERARRQREAVRVIERIGGLVVYDYKLRQAHSPFPVEPPVPKWKLALLGDDFFFDVSYVAFDGDSVGVEFDDGQMTNLRGLTDVEILFLAEMPVTDAGLENLRGLAKLRILFLDLTPVTDAGLENLTGLTDLTMLSLAGTQITDAGLEHVKELVSLEDLNISNTQVSDAGLERLVGLTRLRRLNLDSTEITLEGVKKLRDALPDDCRISCQDW